MSDAPPQLPYRNVGDEPVPPNVFRVLLGVFLILLAIAATSLGGLMLLFTFNDPSVNDLGRFCLVCMMAMCFASNLWLIPRSVRLFKRRLPMGAMA
jgi:hypothetical protein